MDRKNEEKIMVDKNHYLIVPSDPAQQEVTERIEKATWKLLLTEYNLRINSGYLTTFACVYMEAIIRALGRVMKEAGRDDVEINFLGLFTIGANNRQSELAEKDGNINLFLVPGETADAIMLRDYSPIVNPQMWENSILNEVEKIAARILSEKHKAVTDHLFTWTTIAYAYFDNLFRTLKLMAREAHERGESSVTINFLEMAEFHCNLELETLPENEEIQSEKFVVKIRPGFAAKLMIKNDDSTEWRG